MRNIFIAMALSAGLVVPLAARGEATVSKIASLEHSLMPLKMHFSRVSWPFCRQAEAAASTLPGRWRNRSSRNTQTPTLASALSGNPCSPAITKQLPRKAA